MQVQVTFNNENLFCIQGLIFSILFGFMIIFLGLEKNPKVLEYWWYFSLHFNMLFNNIRYTYLLSC